MLRLICAILAVFVLAQPAVAAEYYDEVERDFSLRTIGRLQVTNLRGGITIQGWALDKIRVKAKRKAQASSLEEANRLFRALDFRYRSVDGDIELSAEYGRGLEIQDRLRERENPRTSMEMVVLAPAGLSLRVWAAEGVVHVKAWSAPLEVRTSTGEIRIENIRSDGTSLLCPSCAISARDVRGSLRCMGGTGEVALDFVKGKQVYVETTSGSLRAKHIEGEQLYVTKAGSVAVGDTRGHIEFHTQSGAVEILDGAGFVSGRTETGDIGIRMKEWKFRDKALIESVQGRVAVSLPSLFSGELDVWSVNGKTSVGFPLIPLTETRVFGPEPANRFRGQVGDGGEQLRVYSQSGDVQVQKNI